MKRKILKEDIIVAGRDLMFLNGYADTGIKDITDKISIPKGSFYNHFSSKEEFGLAVLEYYAANGLDMHKRYLEDKSTPPLQRLSEFYLRIISRYDGAMNYKYGCMMGNFAIELADINEKFQVALDKDFHDQVEVIAAVLEEAKDLGELKKEVDSKAMANFIINSWQGALLRMKSSANAEPLEQFHQHIFENYLLTN